MAVVLDALASYVHNMLMEMAKEEVHMLLGISREIESVDKKLEDLRNVLTDADRRNITDQCVKAWVRELRDAMYEATDILDLCQLKAIGREHRQEWGCLNSLLFCMRSPLSAHDIGSRIKKLNQKLDGIRDRSNAFNFNLCSYEDYSRKMIFSRPTSHETSGELNESSVVGEKIEEDTTNLVDMLTKGDENNPQDNNFLIFTIVGVGGIGKTTLAKKIFNNKIIEEKFSKKIWLSINRDFSEIELLRRAIQEAGGDCQAAGITKSMLERTLKEAMKGHKALLVMDDVWDHHAWEGVLETPLANALARGSRVLTTTRHYTVAQGMKAEKPYHHVEKLRPEDAWSLLKKQVVRNEKTEPGIDMLKNIGMGIIANCDYLPLAIKVMGGLLRQRKKTPGDWEKVLKDSTWSETKMPKELGSAIYLSYEDLCPALKQCFLHFSVLPKYLRFFSEDVVGMWISEGFVHPDGDTYDLEELGRKYYEELLLRNLIEPDGLHGETHCSMHDIVRSFGQGMARDEVLIAHMGETDITSKLISQKFIRLSLSNKGSESYIEWSSLKSQKSLRTLVSIGHIKAKHGDSFLTLSSLRTLHLDRINCEALVDTLPQLKHLRYLSMERCGLSILPETIGKMKFLQYIRLSCNKDLVRLPDSIVELRQLRALHLVFTGINSIPVGFNALSNLRILSGFPAHMDGRWCSLQELGPLSQLNLLSITGLKNVSASSFAANSMLGKKFRLHDLFLCCPSMGDNWQLVKEEGISEEEKHRLEDVFDELSPPSCLEKLSLEQYFGRRLPRWMISTTVAPLESLRQLCMVDLAYCTELPNSFCWLPCLEVLCIDGAPAIKFMGHEFLEVHRNCHNRPQVTAAFPRLHTLEFIKMVEWEEWQWEEHVKAMPLLESLRLHSCKLRHVPPGLAFHARSMRKLFVSDVEHLSSLENFPSVVDLEVLHNPAMERIDNLPKLQKLHIVGCPRINVLKGLPALQRLELEDRNTEGNSMERLPRYLLDVNPRHLLVNCNLSLLTSIAAGKSSPEWVKFNHFQQVKAFAHGKSIQQKWYVQYTKEPFSFETNISHSAIIRARRKRKEYAYLTTWPIEDEWPAGDRNAVERQILRWYFRRWRGGERAYYDTRRL